VLLFVFGPVFGVGLAVVMVSCVNQGEKGGYTGVLSCVARSCVGLCVGGCWRCVNEGERVADRTRVHGGPPPVRSRTLLPILSRHEGALVVAFGYSVPPLPSHPPQLSTSGALCPLHGVTKNDSQATRLRAQLNLL
jgi:hypothetical protein